MILEACLRKRFAPNISVNKQARIAGIRLGGIVLVGIILGGVILGGLVLGSVILVRLILGGLGLAAKQAASQRTDPRKQQTMHPVTAKKRQAKTPG